MDGSLLSDLRSPDVFESPAIFSISGLELSDKFLHVFYHLSPARSLIFPVCQSNPTVSCCEVPLNQSSKISHPLPLVLSHNVFWGGFLPLFSLLSCSSIPSRMLFFYFQGVPAVPCIPYVSALHISPRCRKSNTLNQVLKRLVCP